MSNYDISLTPNVEDKLESLDKDVRESFASQIDKLESFPKKYGKPLKGDLHGYWQLRFERSFRIWYTVEESSNTVVVEAIKHKDSAADHY